MTWKKEKKNGFNEKWDVIAKAVEILGTASPSISIRFYLTTRISLYNAHIIMIHAIK